MNSRPLTYVPSDIESGVALRPVDFLTNLCTGTPPVDAATPLEGGDATKMLLRLWKYKQKKLDVMWKQFYDEYLTSLRERGQIWHRNPRSTAKSVPKVGEVVIVKDEDAPRGVWKLGKITKLIESRDRVIRSAEVKLPNKMLINRSISHLYPLEIPHDPVLADPPDATTAEEPDEEFDGFADEEVKVAEDQLPQFIQFTNALGADGADEATALSVGIRNVCGNLLQGLCDEAVPLFH